MCEEGFEATAASAISIASSVRPSVKRLLPSSSISASLMRSCARSSAGSAVPHFLQKLLSSGLPVPHCLQAYIAIASFRPSTAPHCTEVEVKLRRFFAGSRFVPYTSPDGRIAASNPPLRPTRGRGWADGPVCRLLHARAIREHHRRGQGGSGRGRNVRCQPHGSAQD